MPELSQDNLQELQDFWVFDYLIGNLDRHGGNWLVKLACQGQDGKRAILDVTGIDQGAAFYSKHPNTFLAKRNQYKWGELDIAKKDFTDQAKGLAGRIVGMREDLIKVVQAVMTIDPAASDEEVEQVIASLGDRIDVLGRVANGTIQTPADLSTHKNSK